MVRAHPIVLNDGDYLLPVYHETGHDTEFVGPASSSLFFRYNRKTREWKETNRVHSRIGNIQPSVAQIDDNFLVAYSRRGGGYGPLKDGFLVRSESRDGGHTWSRGADSQFPNPNAATDFTRLRNGHLLLAYNDNNEGRRMPLTVAISDDNDQTYKYKRGHRHRRWYGRLPDRGANPRRQDPRHVYFARTPTDQSHRVRRSGHFEPPG